MEAKNEHIKNLNTLLRTEMKKLAKAVEELTKRLGG